MTSIKDGPASPLFRPLTLKGNTTTRGLARAAGSAPLRDHSAHAPAGECVFWGIPFTLRRLNYVAGKPVTIPLDAGKAHWLVFLHTTDFDPEEPDEQGLIHAPHGHQRLGECAAEYVFIYADGAELRVPIRWRREIGMFWRGWGENCLECVAHRKPRTVMPMTDQFSPAAPHWGITQTRVVNPDISPWNYWVWPWENPYPNQPLAALRIEPAKGRTILAAITAGDVKTNPVRWQTRRKALLTLPKGAAFDGRLDDRGLLSHVQIDLGQVISAQPRRVYPDAQWAKSETRALPELRGREVLIEYTAHPEARFHLASGRTIVVSKVEAAGAVGPLERVASATQRVRLRVVEKGGSSPVPARLHVHGAMGEYLAPVDRHRIPNPAWFEDYSCDYVDRNVHFSTYIPGETVIDLPLGRVHIEIAKGFEVKPLRKTVNITARTREITLELDRVLPWRARGWVTADTHVHFLSPKTAQLEGEAEDVNVVNLLASQWGELMTNAGDFDGKTTFGSREAGGNGEYLVRVGTENRQHVLGHISLLGYDGNIIAPMTTGGPDESALGDPVECLVGDWARRCREQRGIVVFPHFPEPRTENAAVLIQGGADAVEFATWGRPDAGLTPYGLADWYRYLNCGYFYPAVGGTDKMSCDTAVGAGRTYARLPDGCEFTYDAWKEAIRHGNTFVTVGPLLEFTVDGRAPGSRIDLNASGGTLDVVWETASCTIPVTRVDLMVNGEIRESVSVAREGGRGHWPVKVDRSSWLALLVRGRFPGSPEVVAAHSSPVMVHVDRSPFFSAADALTILDQIEGAVAYLDTIATRGEANSMKRMRLALTAAYRSMHRRMHEAGYDHAHTAVSDHAEHHEHK